MTTDSKLSRSLFSLWLTMVASASLALGDPKTEGADTANVKWAVKIPMRDGVHLNATLYTPSSQRTPAPCVFTLTPYIADSYHDDATYFAAHGLPFLIVDSRGRGNSEGTFRPMIQEAQDGYDTVEWISQQSYCNGKVAMWGLSYMGYDQWATAKELPPHLASLAPAAAHYSVLNWPLRNNVFSEYSVPWLTFVAGTTNQFNLSGDQSFWKSIHRRWLKDGAPFMEMDGLAGVPSATLQEWLSHPTADAYWDAQGPSPEQYARITVPILTITGIYDGCQPGALGYYREHMRYGNADAKNHHYLIIGPWDHEGTRKPAAQFGGLQFGPASMLDLQALHREWYAWTMESGPRPAFLQKRVAYYVTGAEVWRFADTIEGVTARSSAFYLDSTVNPVDVFHSGTLSATPVASGQHTIPDHYVYDPRDVSRVELQLSIDADSRTNQRMIYASNGVQLVYHSAPFEADTEISGFFKLTAWLSIDQPDTDFLASIYEVGPDGASIFLSNDIIRARYRESLRESRLISTREPMRYDFERFTFVSRRIGKGSRLRLVVSPADHDSYALWEKNYNSGGTVSGESKKDGRRVTVRLFHDQMHPSVLLLPFGQPGDTAAR